MFEIGKIYNGFEIIKLLPHTGSGYDKKYLCRCTKCNNFTEKYSSNIMKRGCGICSNKIIVKGINDSLTTNPELLKYVVDKEDFETKSAGSNKKVKAKCPYCGYIKNINLHNLLTNGIGCPRCGDGISFANKFVFNLLQQCNVEFENEKRFDWSNGKIYDIYLPTLSIIIENHGKQHYSKNGFNTLGGKTIDEEKNNDNQKKLLALSNGIKQYIELDCYNSTLEHIKASVIKSNLLTILNTDEKNIDWEQCLKFACKNLIKEVAYLFENNNMTTSEIGKKYGLTKQTIIHYLKVATKLGWCNYNPKNEMKRIGAINGHNKSQKVICYEHSEIIYDNAIQCKNALNKTYNYGLNENNIRNTCRYKQMHHKKLHFFYYNNMNNIDLEVIGVEEGTGRNKGTLGALVVKYKNNTVNVGSGFTDEERSYYWNNQDKIIGRVIEVKYKEITTDKKTGLESLQFPVYVGLRENGKEVSYN